MTIKKFVRTGAISTIAMLASNNAAFAMSCESGLDGYCLTDGNANFSVVYDTTNDEYGMDMSVDGNTQVWVLDFMIDNPTNNGPAAVHNGLNAYGSGLDGTLAGNNLLIENKAVDGGGYVDLNFTLNYNGTNSATLTQTFTFTNDTGGDLSNLSFLALTDVSLGGFGAGFNDQGQLTTGGTINPTGYRQWSNNPSGLDFELLASVNVAVDDYEVSVADFSKPCTNGDLCDRAYTDKALALSNSVYAGEEDLIMAARWLRTVAAGTSFSYTQTFEISELSPEVPVPAAVWLFGSGLLGLVGVARRKTSLKA